MLGKLDLTPEQFRSEFIVLKPCVHGSDAHEIAKIGKPDEDRFCWIKATPTFEGLRQILFEPEARVYIGDNAPVVKNDYQVIRSIRVAGAFSWFSEQEIPINRDLVSIIGGRGTGKSALAELIAFAGGADTFRAPRERDIQDTFLFKASKKSPQNPQPVTGAELTLTWRDNQKSVVKITDGLNHGLTEPKVKYLAQRFVETLCAPENTSQIEREIERVIFNRIPVTRRYGASNFQELRETATKANQVKKRRVTAAIEDLNKLIYDSFVKVGSKAEKQQGLRQTQGGLQSLLKQTPELPPQNKNDIEQLEKLDLLRKQLEGMIVGLREQQNAIDTLEARFHAFEDEIRTFNEETRALVEAAGLSERLPEFLATAPPNALRYIDQRRSELSNQIRIITEGPTAPGGPTLQAVIGEIEAVRQRLQLSDVKRNEYDKFHKDKQTLESAIASLSREIAEIDNTVEPILEVNRTARKERYLDYFDALHEEREALESLYEPLHQSLATGGETSKKLVFISKISFDAAEHARVGMDIIDARRKGPYKEEGGLEYALKKLFVRMENEGFRRDKIREAMADFRESFLRDADGKEIKFADQLRKGKTGEDFNNWFFSIQSFTVKYSIKFENRELQLLSPGQKGIVLLLVYLEVDQGDTRPLIIDQPEDNLDNLSVYSNLIEYFRQRKKTRQIIIITHNPNLVVNTDAEQIVIADYDGTRSPRIRYRSGALEDTRESGARLGIREGVCEVVEGGTEAFLKREEKYSLPGPYN